MKAYNEVWIANREMVRQAESWRRRNLLTDEQLATVRRTYPVGFQQTSTYIEIGLFLFTTVAILGVYLLVNTFISLTVETSTTSGIINLLFGSAVALVGRGLTNRRRLYRNGVDNAFVAMQTSFWVLGLNQLFPPGLSVATHCLISLPLLLSIVWYYGDTLIAFFATVTFYALLFDWLLDRSWGRPALPFVMMGVSLGLYALARQARRWYGQTLYYTDSINLVQWCALIGLIAWGNYFVNREVNRLLLTPIPEQAPEPPQAFLFWVLTYGIPGALLQLGLSRKDRILIISGALGLIGAVMTLHHYLRLVPLNVALILGGLLLIGLAIAVIYYLRQPRHGFTDAPDDESPDEFFLNTETLAAMQAAGGLAHGNRDDLKFGGGDFGGGGSEGNY